MEWLLFEHQHHVALRVKGCGAPAGKVSCSQWTDKGQHLPGQPSIHHSPYIQPSHPWGQKEHYKLAQQQIYLLKTRRWSLTVGSMLWQSGAIVVMNRWSGHSCWGLGAHLRIWMLLAFRGNKLKNLNVIGLPRHPTAGRFLLQSLFQ